MATRGAGMPIVPIHRADAGAQLDAGAVVTDTPPVQVGREDAAVAAGPPAAPAMDAAQPPAEPVPDAGTTPPPPAAGPLPEPIHRYSFSGGGSNVPDHAGGADAIVRGDAQLDGAGAVSFPGQGDGFVALPDELLGEVTSFTVLVWLFVESDACWQRAFDLLYALPNNSATSLVSLFLTPYGCPDGLPTLGYLEGNAKHHLIGATPVAAPGLVQLGASYSARSQTLRLIVNGAVQKEQSVPVDVRQLARASGMLGRSQFEDPQLQGTITELRVYGSRLEPGELQEIYRRGPDAL